MSLRTIQVLLLCFTAVLPGVAAGQVRIVVKDTSGTPIPDALVIVQDLNHQEREIFRALTDREGNLAPRTLSPGLYRAIATYPYGRWETAVREFLVRDQTLTVQIGMAAQQGHDEIAVSIGELTVHIRDAAGKPVDGARVLVRDAEAHRGSEHWGTTNAQGTATLQLTMTPAVLIVVYGDKLYTFPTAGLETERTLRLK
jgi:hypothetical protein